MNVAIIGSGPAGCYLAEQLLRNPAAHVAVIERLPVPFGLIRYGVAPDHQGTKAVARVLDKVLSRDRVRFFGNVEVGRDVTLDELMSTFDAVAIATGAPCDRKLGITGEDLPGVVPSGQLVAWYSGHPDSVVPPLHAVQSAVVIGNGNVALDVARVLAKSSEEFAGSDLFHDVAAQMASLPLREIHIVGRRGPADAKFSEHELTELGTLQRASVTVEAGHARSQSHAAEESPSQNTPVLEVLQTFAATSAAEKPITIFFHFHLAPAVFVGSNHLTAVRFRKRDGGTRDIAAQLAITCIGYQSRSCCTATPENGVFRNEGGRIRERLYVTGWAMRGPSGTIPTNRTDAQHVGARIAAEVTASPERAGSAALAALLASRNIAVVDHAGWKRIDAAEIAAASADRCRRKFTSVREMLACQAQAVATNKVKH